ncbi:hypothetical protein LCGC14_1143700 [marine sediment metagenome]|uniref:Uncharacterized protein n=1 Tax=marine sediment metagenome TaxID=412755 RepID=A0A0F9M2D7_9ZZZZ
MSLLFNSGINVYHFGGDGPFSRTLNAAAVVDGGRSGEGQSLVTIADTSTDVNVGDFIYIESTDNYDGLHKIFKQAAGSFDIQAKFVAETLANTDDILVTVTEDEKWQFVGFHLVATTSPATSEDLSVDVDADRGASWDDNLYTKDMDTIDNIIYYPDKPVLLEANDLVEFTYANTNTVTWGLKVLTAKLV